MCESARHASDFRLVSRRVNDNTTSDHDAVKQDKCTTSVECVGFGHAMLDTAVYAYSSNKSLIEVVAKIAVTERWSRSTKIRILNRTPRRSRHTIPRNKRLLSTLRRRLNQLVVNRENRPIPNPGPGTRKTGVGNFVVVAVSRDGDPADGSGGGLSGEPDDDVFPVVTMAEAGAGTVFGHVPGVHDGVGTVVGGGAGVDLARGGTAHAV